MTPGTDDAPPALSPPGAPRRRLLHAPWRALLHVLGAKIRCGSLVVVTPEGERLAFAATPLPSAILIVHRWRALRRLLTGGAVGFADSYIDGDWSSPDPARLIELALANEGQLAARLRGFARLRMANRLRHRRRRNTRIGSRRNIAEHYDLGNAFYARWLDPSMTYSSALYATGRETLGQAQAAKNRRVVELLALDKLAAEGPARAPRVLEIGCGWGRLAEQLIGDHGCHVTALTLSRAQLAYAQDRIAGRGLEAGADLRLEDYRDVAGRFDRIVSIEMLEAVGEAYWPRFFAVVRDRLVDGGIAVLQVITIADSRFQRYRRTPDFIQRHIFPGGMLPSPGALQREIARAGLTLNSVERFGASYERTLAAWRRRFERAWPALAEEGFTPRFRRVWSYYLAYCEAGFRVGAIDVGLYRIVKPCAGAPDG